MLGDTKYEESRLTMLDIARINTALKLCQIPNIIKSLPITTVHMSACFRNRCYEYCIAGAIGS